MAGDIALTVNGEPVMGAATGSLLDVLRERLGLRARRTAAVRKASVAAARCSSTVSRGSRV
jgi:hypothetical protein